METGTIRLGVIGLGAMGRRMLDVASAHPEFVVLQASDVREVRLDPSVSFTTNARELVESPELDAVYIATPPKFHAELAIAAMKSGKAVFCEKPLSISLDDGSRMVEAAEHSDVASAVNFALSDRHATLDMEWSLAAGAVGTVVGVDIRLSFPLWPRDFQAGARWLGQREQGGFVREVLSHFVYLTDRLLGPLHPVDVGVDYPAGDRQASEVAARGLLRSGDVPVQVSAFSGAAAPELYEWILWGTKRSYLLRDWDQLFVSDGGEWTPVQPRDDSGSETTRLSLFAKAVRGEHLPALADFATAFRVQQAIEAFLVS